jgi:polyhydroxyalkanoate synthesis repressor PhaR
MYKGAIPKMCCTAIHFSAPRDAEALPAMQNKTSRDSKTSQRVIKKYPNRRLYDTDTSSYITLAEIKRLVMESEPFVVRDVKTGEDLTRSILLQIILEEEASGSPMFTTPVLANIIRFYGHAMQGMMGGYLEKNIQALMDMQAPMMQGVAGNNPFQLMQEQMQKQTEQFLNTFGLKR